MNNLLSLTHFGRSWLLYLFITFDWSNIYTLKYLIIMFRHLHLWVKLNSKLLLGYLCAALIIIYMWFLKFQNSIHWTYVCSAPAKTEFRLFNNFLEVVLGFLRALIWYKVCQNWSNGSKVIHILPIIVF